eukprot:1391691-Amorphochlora_amoeboformis.AAC.1
MFLSLSTRAAQRLRRIRGHLYLHSTTASRGENEGKIAGGKKGEGGGGRLDWGELMTLARMYPEAIQLGQ